MDPIAILGAAIIAIGAITPIIVKYYNRAEKFLVVIQMFLDVYKEFLVARADNHFTEEEYANMGRKFEGLATYVDECIDINAWINKKQA